MNATAQWLIDLGEDKPAQAVDGLVTVADYKSRNLLPEEYAIMEKAESYGAHSVFFEAPRNGKHSIAQAFIFVFDTLDEIKFAELHKRLWSWGGVPIVYRKTFGKIDLFRCAHKPDFLDKGRIIYKPRKTLDLIADIEKEYEVWWDATTLRNGTIWDDKNVCEELLSAKNAAHKKLFDAIFRLNNDLAKEKILDEQLQRKLLILSLLIAYLEEREVLGPDYFNRFLRGATNYFQILRNAESLIKMLEDLENKFNGHVFLLKKSEQDLLRYSKRLSKFSDFIEGRVDNNQMTLWRLYSFTDLPVELISQIYQIFVKDKESSVYTPPFLVRFILEELLSLDRIERLHEKNEIILDPCCGSGIFLVEAYKRLILHWRSRNNWKRPSIVDLKRLIYKVHGIDNDDGAVELAAFSLCLALCDALKPEEIRESIKLFPKLENETLHKSCFFEGVNKRIISQSVGAIIGNPPFRSTLGTPGAEECYKKYESKYGRLPDKQLAYLFLHESMELLSEGGILGMLQQYNFLYNRQSKDFRNTFINEWNVKEILDFISVQGLFRKSKANTKIIVLIAEASKPKENEKVLHAVFRRSGRVVAEQGFDIDYYDLHWHSRKQVLRMDEVWRTNLLGGGRVLYFFDRLNKYKKIKQVAKEQDWVCGEGFTFGTGKENDFASHVIGKQYIPSIALYENRLDASKIDEVPKKPIERPRAKEIYEPPLLLIHKQMNLNHGLWKKGYLTYSHEIFGISAARKGQKKLEKLNKWMHVMRRPLQSFIICRSASLSTAKATAILSNDILSLPYPDSESLDISENENILVDDIVDYYNDLIRLGENSKAMKESAVSYLADFADVYARQINTIYYKKTLKTLHAQVWSGVICQPFIFGDGDIDWSDAEGLRDKLNKLLKDKQRELLHITRIARIYDDRFIFLIKPDRLRYWLRSVALRDADETLADLRDQGF